jgi:hypothetical protein
MTPLTTFGSCLSFLLPASHSEKKKEKKPDPLTNLKDYDHPIYYLQFLFIILAACESQLKKKEEKLIPLQKTHTGHGS